MDVEKEIEGIIRTKRGNTEIALFRDEDGSWSFLLGNTSGAVSLGESRGEIEMEGQSIEDVINQMQAEVRRSCQV